MASHNGHFTGVSCTFNKVTHQPKEIIRPVTMRCFTTLFQMRHIMYREMKQWVKQTFTMEHFIYTVSKTE
jgi:hypothetical protein